MPIENSTNKGENSIIKIDAGKLSETANLLIEKFAGAIGAICEPLQIIRLAKANAEADIIKTKSKIKITEIERRAVRRFMFEEIKKQNNLENILEKSLPHLNKNAKPGELLEDWIINFVDKCKLISDKEMQELWARILAGEVNTPGTFSKRTINQLSSLDKQDAIMFTKLCNFNWIFKGEGNTPIVYNLENDIYRKNGLTFDVINHLSSIGLITFESLGYLKAEFPKKLEAIYQHRLFIIEFPKINNTIKIGHVLLTSVGDQLANISNPEPIEGFSEYVIEQWKKQGIVVLSEVAHI